MKAVVKKWGNSASVRIPAAVLQAAKLRLDDSVDCARSPAALLSTCPAQGIHSLGTP